MTAVSLLFHDVYTSDPADSGFRSPAANRYKLTVAEFEAQLDGLVALRAPNRIAPVPVLVTVDDGGVSYATAIADVLEARGIRGHSFISTDFIGRLNSEYLRASLGSGRRVAQADDGA